MGSHYIPDCDTLLWAAVQGMGLMLYTDITLISGIQEGGGGVGPQGWVTFGGGDLLQEVGRILAHRALKP